MIIDAHQHFWNYNPMRDAWITEDMNAIRTDFTPVDLWKELKANGVDGSVVVQADQSEAETEFLLDISNKYDFVKGVVGWVDLTDKNVEKRLLLYKNKTSKLKGFRHIVEAEPDDQFLLRTDFCRGIKLLQQYGYTYDILIYPKQLPAAIQFIERFPEQKFVIDHIAKPDIKNNVIEPWSKQMEIMASHPNVWCKLSGMITESDWETWTEDDLTPYLNVIFELFGTEKLIFGSDWPVCLLAGTYREVKQIITHYIQKMPEGEKDAVMGENAVEFYNL